MAPHIMHLPMLIRGSFLEVLRKSQLGLFDPHHVEYMRRNQSGTVSRIAARGAQRPQVAPPAKQGELDFSGAQNRPARTPRTRTPKPTPPPAPRAVYAEIMTQGRALLDGFRDKVRANNFRTRSFDHLVEHFSEGRDYDACVARADRIMKPSRDMGITTMQQASRMMDFLSLVGLGSVNSLNYVQRLEPGKRAFANSLLGSIAINQDTSIATLYHEAAHHIEFTDHSVLAAAREFRDTKARNCGQTQPKKLSQLVPGSNYKDDEVALQDNFCSAYVGKVYNHGATEVISMGLQHFTNRAGFEELSFKDPAHLEFMVGVLDYLKKKEEHEKKYPPPRTPARRRR